MYIEVPMKHGSRNREVTQKQIARYIEQLIIVHGQKKNTKVTQKLGCAPQTFAKALEQRAREVSDETKIDQKR